MTWGVSSRCVCELEGSVLGVNKEGVFLIGLCILALKECVSCDATSIAPELPGILLFSLLLGAVFWPECSSQVASVIEGEGL